MSTDNTHDPKADAIPKSPDTIKSEWDAGVKGQPNALFQPDQFDLYVNKMTLEAYVFHLNVIDHSVIDHLEYDPDEFTVDVVKTDGSRVDLGMKITWLLRPYWSRAAEVSIIRTENQKSIEGKTVPMIHKKKA